MHWLPSDFLGGSNLVSYLTTFRGGYFLRAYTYLKCAGFLGANEEVLLCVEFWYELPVMHWKHDVV